MNNSLHLIIKELNDALNKVETINLRTIDSLRHIEQKTTIEISVLRNTEHLVQWSVVPTDLELIVIKIKIATFYLNLLADNFDKLQDDLSDFIEKFL